MSGFPARFARSALGPTFVDAYPVENPEQDIGATQANLAAWQLAGLNGCAPRALLAAYWDSGTSAFVIASQAEAWNSDGAQSHPALARAAAGDYTYTFASTYLDELGASVSPALVGAVLAPARVLTAFADRIITAAWIDPTAPLVVELRQWNAAGSATDHPFVLLVF
jgi:hypothetical protein